MTPRRQAGDRLRRVVAMAPYIQERGEVAIAELAEVFAVSEAEVEADLNALFLCGVPPYTPDRMINVSIVDGHVSISFAEFFSRPLRLTPAEGFTLLATGWALLAVPGVESAGPLASALEKLERTLGAGEVVDVDMGDVDHLDVLRRAADARRSVELDYYSFGRDEVTARLVDPYSLGSVRGNWYLAGHCHTREDDRLFRLDRIRAVRETDQAFERPEGGGELPEDAFAGSPDDVDVLLSLPPEAGWVAESYPVEGLETLKSGRIHLRLRVAARPWLERLLLQVGAKGRVLEPRDWRGIGADAARRVLDRYESP